ncbi:helix-turn-helix domain-containing protein [Xanthobacter oligotrophicus]|uniref:Helix-turn-helix domain-containing protein n=1 Tax=Xanthobacter oligotrophicus TaxID=2607286 RepID=A0ABW6ZV67_9HYPH
MTTGAANEGKDDVQSLVRGLDVVRTFSQYKPRMILSEVAQHAGLIRSAKVRLAPAHRLAPAAR